jgi:hypothetical protein
MSGIEEFYVHQATIETLTGSGAYGDVFAAPVVDTGFLEGATRLVRNVNGEQVIAFSTWYTSTANAPHYTTDSRFTDPNGRKSRVITVNVNDSGILGLPDHVAVSLT